MTRTEARAAIRVATDHEGATDTQVTDTQLNTWIDLEHRKLRKVIASKVPSLYASTTAEQTLTTADVSFDLPADFDSLIRFERQYGVEWTPVEVSDELVPHVGDMTFREEGAALKVGPGVLAPGTYRAVYVPLQAALTADSGAGGTLLVPDGFEDVIVERVAARVQLKLDDDPAPHEKAAKATFDELITPLKKRYGRHVRPGLRKVRHW